MAHMLQCVLAFAISLCLSHVQAKKDSCSLPPMQPKRGAAMLQSPTIGSESPDMAASNSGVVVIPLKRKAARLNEIANIGKSAMVGNVTVGYPPQRFEMLFDTTSGHVFLPHRVCKSTACREHNRFSSLKSTTAEDIDFNGSRVQKQHRLAVGKVLRDATTTEFAFTDFGSGQAKALLVRDRVCLRATSNAKICAWPGVNMGISEDDTPFRAMPNDGIIGLGLLGLSASPELNFLEKMFQNGKTMSPQFGISLTSTGGELHIGGQLTTAMAAPLQWFPVHSPEEGFWQVPILAVRIGNRTVDACEKGCHALIDTSASRLGVQKSNLPKLRSALMHDTASRVCQGPELKFDLGGMTVSLGPEDYLDQSENGCLFNMGSLDVEEPAFVGVYSFGVTVLRHYYVAFNWQDKTIGFAPSRTAVKKVGIDVEQIFM